MKSEKLRGLIILFAAVSVSISCSASNSLSTSEIFNLVQNKIASYESNDVILNSMNDYSLWWVNDDGYSIINDGSDAVELQFQGCDAEFPVDFSESQLQLVDEIKGVLLKNGFTISKQNTSKSRQDDEFYDYVVGFEKSDLKAVVVISPDCWASGEEPFHQSFTFSYTDEFSANAAAQLPYLEDLGMRDGEVIHVEKVEGDFALINVNYRRTGHFIVAKRINNRWKEIFGGQDSPSCALLQKWNVPAGFIDCYE